MLQIPWRPVLFSLAAGVAGVLLCLGALHLYRDHGLFHTYLHTHQVAAPAAARPAQPVAPVAPGK